MADLKNSIATVQTKRKILITGAAGFIGFHLVQHLIKQGDEVIGLDNINDYYDIRLKYGRLAETGIQAESIEYAKMVTSRSNPGYRFILLNLEDKDKIMGLFSHERFDIVINLAAQAGVRYSLTNPQCYIDSNISGFFNILEACREYPVRHLVYASSSSVYGLQTRMPFSVHQSTAHPISLYAATKKANELMAHAYSHLFTIPTTGLRFFTVYGPWGRPDMALFLFVKNILEGKPIMVFNNGEMQRDFTYIDDIVKGVLSAVEKPAKPNPAWNGDKPDPGTSTAPFRLFNLRNSSPVNLMDVIRIIEEVTGKKAIIAFKPMQEGDVKATWADIESTHEEFGYSPTTRINDGVRSFIAWYYEFYNIGKS